MKDEPLEHSKFGGDSYEVAMPVPSSLFSLPKLVLPSSKHEEEFRLLERSLLKKHGVKPGVYSSWDDVKDFLIDIHDELIESLCSKLHEIDSLDLSKELYDTLETIYGNHRLSTLSAAPEVLIERRSQVSVEHFHDWGVLSHWSLAIRYLIEMAVKHGKHPAMEIGLSKRLGLIALSREITELDFFMDHLSLGALPYELTIDDNLVIGSRPSQRTITALKRWEHDAKPHMFKRENDELAGLRRLAVEPVKESDLTDSNEWRHLDNPMKQELGYSLTEWLHFNSALISFFGPNERLKVRNKKRLQVHLEKITNLPKQTIDLLLEDRILSPVNLASASIRAMLPSESFWRDLRLMNRPIVELDHHGKKLIIIGIETVEGGGKVFFDRLMEGRLRFPRAQVGGPIEKAIGALYTHLGDQFRDEIIEECQSKGIEAMAEKANAGKINKPEGIGPVDIFVVDRQRKRFILGEAKDIAGDLESGEIKIQKKRFTVDSGKEKSFISKLREQESWFRSHLAELKVEFEIEGTEEWTVEAVIIVNSPFPWVYVYERPLPILDNIEFLKRLGSGKNLTLESYS